MPFLQKCAAEVGKFEEDEFNMGTWKDIHRAPIESAIQQWLHIALKAVQQLNHLPECKPLEHGNEILMDGFWIRHEVEFESGAYRVDFLIQYWARQWHERADESLPNATKEVIVECDSQEFHDRTEKERRYEKKRDRYFQARGFKVFRYTGKEIMENGLHIAAQLFAYLLDREIDELSIDASYESASDDYAP